MTTAMEGRACDPFALPKDPFVSEIFLGTYATEGAPGDAVDPLAKDKEKEMKKEKEICPTGFQQAAMRSPPEKASGVPPTSRALPIRRRRR